MGIGSWGGGIVLGLVAVLWLVYLIPSWAKRQQYLATERNAVRLQQTLRILAQTADLPDEIRVEANAKSVASAQKILRSEEAKREAIRRAHEAARQRALTRELAAAAPVLTAAASQPELAARRLRRTRLMSTLLLVLSVVGFVFGASHIVTAWFVFAASTIAGVGAVVVLMQLSAVSKARARRAPTATAAVAPPVAQEFQDFAPRTSAASVEAEIEDPAAGAATATARSWTPVAVPRPLYLRRGSARALARSSAVAASPTSDGDTDALLAAAASSAQALRASQDAARQAAQREALREVARAEAALQARDDAAQADSRPAPVVERVAPQAAPPAPVVAAPPVAPSRFARMGYLDEGETSEFSLDDILQRRRAV